MTFLALFLTEYGQKYDEGTNVLIFDGLQYNNVVMFMGIRQDTISLHGRGTRMFKKF